MRKYFKYVLMGLIPVFLYAGNEITTSITLKATKNYLDFTRAVSLSFGLTNASPNAIAGTQTISTNATPEAITVGNVSTNGWAYFRNLTTNVDTYIELGWSDTTNFRAIVRLKPSEPACFRLTPGAAFYGHATGTNSILEKMIIDD